MTAAEWMVMNPSHEMASSFPLFRKDNPAPPPAWADFGVVIRRGPGGKEAARRLLIRPIRKVKLRGFSGAIKLFFFGLETNLGLKNITEKDLSEFFFKVY